MENVSSRCGKSDNAPRLRFPEFSGEWVEKKLREIIIEVKRKAEENSKAPVMMISATEGFINQSERYSSNNAGKSLKKYTLLKKGELAYNHGYSKTRNFGSCFTLEIEQARIPFVYHSFSLKGENDSVFWGKYLNSGLFDGKLRRLVASTARMDGLLNISFENYSSMPVNIPSLPEQKKIAAFFTLLDRRIQKQRQFVERLKTYKRGVFSVLLNSFSKYETLLLENCASIKKGEQLNKTDMIKNGKYYVLNGGVAASGRTDNFNTDKNTISISEGGNSCGFVLFNTEKFWSGGHCYTLQNLKQNVNNQYLFHYLKFHEKQIMSLRVGSGLPNIQKSELEKFEVLLPSEDIQNKIANIMSNITSYEDVVKKELLNLDKLKLALLQKMFI